MAKKWTRIGTFMEGQGLVEAQAMARAFELASDLVGNVERVVHGKTEQVRLVLAALISGGHVLFEDMPGTAKTVVAAYRGVVCRSTDDLLRLFVQDLVEQF